VQTIRQFVLEFVSPLALNHGQHLLTAAAHVWNERRHRSASMNAKSVSLLSADDSLLVQEAQLSLFTAPYCVEIMLHIESHEKVATCF